MLVKCSSLTISQATGSRRKKDSLRSVPSGTSYENVHHICHRMAGMSMIHRICGSFIDLLENMEIFTYKLFCWYSLCGLSVFPPSGPLGLRTVPMPFFLILHKSVILRMQYTSNNVSVCKSTITSIASSCRNVKF